MGATDDNDQDAEASRPAEPTTGSPQTAGPRLSPVLIATLVTIPVMVIVAFITYAALRPDDAPPIESYRTQAAPQCPAFLAALPDTFKGFGTKAVSDSQASWPNSESGGDPLVVRCGVERPAGLAPTSNLQVVHPVQWFITDTIDGVGQAYVCVDHRPYVAIWVPANAGNGPITDVSALIDRELPRAPLDFG
ncbi:DUF3515 domain-containing protein [Gordonia soli]|uniref:DUF3515 domain-containing protein n=1 Tax=Gordonia soli TaxID=320799 RepID=UPI0003459E2A|nr:DUF3515 domain-containing protein [Gordonia soli]